MSLISPNKQNRLERHLMRSRGAGTRTIESYFGFSFAFSAPAAVDLPLPTSTLDSAVSAEPPAKRRRTVFNEDDKRETTIIKQRCKPGVDAVVEPVEALEDGLCASKRRKPNARRKVRIEENESRHHDHATDSPFAQSKDRRSRVKTSKKEAELFGFPKSQDDQVTQVARNLGAGGPVEKTTKSRKRKVKSDDMVETVQDRPMPVAVRLPVEPRTRRRNAVNKVSEVSQEPAEDEEPVQENRRRRNARDANQKSKEKTLLTSLDTSPATTLPTIPVRIAEMSSAAADAPKCRAQRAAEPSIPRNARVSDDHAASNPAGRTLSEASRFMTSIPPTAMPLDSESGLMRRPLTETDVNRTLLSCYPKKMNKTSKGAKEQSKKASQDLERTVRGDRSKIAARQAAQVLSITGELPGTPDMRLAPGANETEAKASDCRDFKSTTVSPQSHTSERIKRQKPHQSGACTIEKEEEIDWLFAPQEERKYAPTSLPRKTNRTPASRRANVDNPAHQMDLDDLVSDIGTLVGVGAGKMKGPKRIHR